VAARPELDALLRALADPDDLAGLLPAAELAARGELPDQVAAEAAAVPDWPVAVARLRSAVDDFQREYAGELATFRPEVLAAFALDTWHIEAQEAGKRFFGRGRRLRAVAAQLVPFQLPGAEPVTGDDVREVLVRLVAARAHAADLHQQARAVAGLPLPADWLPTDADAAQRLAYAEQVATTGRDLLATHPRAWETFARGLDPAAVEVLDRTVAAWRAWRGVLEAGPAELRDWAGELSWYDAWQRDGAEWHAELTGSGLLPLRRWTTVLGYADVLAGCGLVEFRDRLLTGAIPADLAEEAYQRGIVATSLAERLREGGLDYFDAELHGTHLREFERAADRLRAVLPERLPSALVRRRPFTAADRRDRFADFTAELRRKRGGRSFRELFGRYPDIVLALTPCVLVSPASAATFLAPDATRFDLVVFDEASQIRVAEAVGAMGRGRSAVIVGDSRQMPPTAIMQVSQDGEEAPYDDEDLGGPVPEDLESILSEAVESGLPQQWLSWHYRSRDESLIAFSN
ncbi:MAG TPA: AAA domain-containing protein, partial [Micromonospora sp.]